MAAWAIPSGVLAPRLRAMMFAVSVGGIEAGKKKVADAVQQAEYDAIAGDDDEIGTKMNQSDDDSDNEYSAYPTENVDEAVVEAALRAERKEKLAKLVQARKKKGVQVRFILVYSYCKDSF